MMTALMIILGILLVAIIAVTVMAATTLVRRLYVVSRRIRAVVEGGGIIDLREALREELGEVIELDRDVVIKVDSDGTAFLNGKPLWDTDEEKQRFVELRQNDPHEATTMLLSKVRYRLKMEKL